MSQSPNQPWEVLSIITLTATLGKAASIPVKKFLHPSLPKNHIFYVTVTKALILSENIPHFTSQH